MNDLKFALLAITIFLFSCQIDKNETTDIEKNITDKKTEQLIPYSDFLKKINFKKLSSTEKKERFFKFVNQDILSYWKGTPWDFNGVTRIPREGNIACGYFVTNTLTDFGFNIKRIWLAQQASSVMIKELCASKSIKTYHSMEGFTNYFKTRKEKEIFIVGLDYHTGYIIKDGDKVYFLHSYFANKIGIIKEEIAKSDALKSSNIFVIGSLSQSSLLFK